MWYYAVCVAFLGILCLSRIHPLRTAMLLRKLLKLTSTTCLRGSSTTRRQVLWNVVHACWYGLILISSALTWFVHLSSPSQSRSHRDGSFNWWEFCEQFCSARLHYGNRRVGPRIFHREFPRRHDALKFWSCPWRIFQAYWNYSCTLRENGRNCVAAR